MFLGKEKPNHQALLKAYPATPDSKQLAIVTQIWNNHPNMEIPQKLIEYINVNRAPLPPVTDPNEPLQIDSLGIIRLVSFMESDCGIRVEDDELLPENFATLRNLGKLIAKKSQNAEAAP